MNATSEYLNKPVRSLDEFCRDLERRRINTQNLLDLIYIEQKMHAANEFRRVK